MNIRTYLLMPALALSLCTAARAQKLAGGDISMLPRYEQAGVTYYTHDGQSISDLITYSRQVGMNAMRVRLFVNPKRQTTNGSAPYTWSTDDNVCQDITWLKTLGKRIKDAGMKVWPYSDEGQKQFTNDLIAILNKHSHVDGLFWWWPEYNAKTNSTSFSGWYNAPLFDSNTGRATSAFTALAKYATTSTGISQLNVNMSKTTDDSYYDLSGRSASQPKDSGVYIHHKKKIIVR